MRKSSFLCPQKCYKAGILAKESTAKMRHIKNKGVEFYDGPKELGDYVRAIEASLGPNGTYKQVPGNGK